MCCQESDTMLFKCIDCGKRHRANHNKIKHTYGVEGHCTLYRCYSCWKGKRAQTEMDMTHLTKIKELGKQYKNIKKVD